MLTLLPTLYARLQAIVAFGLIYTGRLPVRAKLLVARKRRVRLSRSKSDGRLLIVDIHLLPSYVQLETGWVGQSIVSRRSF